MPKRQKPSPATNPKIQHALPAATVTSALVAHPPAKNPSLLGVSILLFSLWFLFLFVAAFWG